MPRFQNLLVEGHEFGKWINQNQEILATIARQGGIEGLIRNISGAFLERENPTFQFISERHRFDMVIADTANNNLLNSVEFKHNFSVQKELSTQRLIKAMAQVCSPTPGHEVGPQHRQVVYIVTEIVENSPELIQWGKKYNFDDPNRLGAEAPCNWAPSYDTWQARHISHRAFPLVAMSLRVNLHFFVYDICPAIANAAPAA